MTTPIPPSPDGAPRGDEGVADGAGGDGRAAEAPAGTFTAPSEHRPAWASTSEAESWAAAGSAAGEPGATASSGASVGTAVAEPAGVGRRRPSSGGPVLAAALLSAVLASGGTILGLAGAGLIGPARAPSGVGTPVEGVGTRQPITIDESSAIIDAAAKVSPAVVRIFVGSVPDDLGVIPDAGVGSGVIFDAGGWILTNRHVVQDPSGQQADRLTVELKDGREFEGRVYGVDTLTDLAIVRVDGRDLPTAPIGSSADLKVGQLAIAIGSPLGTYSNTVTSGIVSATGRSVTVDGAVRLNNLIQTDAAINPGNSGGPLLDAAGNVIGINTAVAADSTGIGFAIPIDLARPLMAQALAGQPLARPYVGIRYEVIDLQLKEREGLPVDHGALIGPGRDGSGGELPAIVPGGPADKAGLRDGDIIVAINDRQIDAEHPLDAVLSGFAPGQSVEVHILRGGEALTLSVTLGTRPPDL